MRRLIILILIALSISLILAYAIQQDTGYLRISVGHWLIESNIWVFATLNLLFIAALYFLLSVVRGSVHVGQRLSHFFGHSAGLRAKQTTEKGIIAFLEGNWENARKLLIRSARKNSSPIINYLAAAHASNELGQIKEAENLLKKAYESAPDSEFAVGIAQTQIQIHQGQFEAALATLMRLKKTQPHHPFVLKQLKAVYLKLEDWQQLIKLIPLLRKDLKEDETALQELETLAWSKLLVQKTDEVINRNQLDNATELLADLWKKMPDKICINVSLVQTYAKQLLRVGQAAESETLLRITLNQHWHDDLVALYGTIPGADPSEQLIHAENWLKERPNNATLLLALGRLSLQNELWGKALEYFEASRRLHHTKESMAELCRLKLKMKKPQENLTPLLEDLIGLIDLPKLPLPK
jgi:HemY protein